MLDPKYMWQHKMHVTDPQKPNIVFSSNIPFRIAKCVAENHLFLGGNTSRLVDLAPSLGQLEIVLHLDAMLLREYDVSPFDLVRKNLVYVAKSMNAPSATVGLPGFSGIWKEVFGHKNNDEVFVACLRLKIDRLVVDLSQPEIITLSFVNDEVYNILQGCDARVEEAIDMYIRVKLLTELRANTDLSKDISNSITTLQELPVNDPLMTPMQTNLQLGFPTNRSVDTDISLQGKSFYDDDDFDPSEDEIKVLHSDDDIKVHSDDSTKINEDDEITIRFHNELKKDILKDVGPVGCVGFSNGEMEGWKGNSTNDIRSIRETNVSINSPVEGNGILNGSMDTVKNIENDNDAINSDMSTSKNNDSQVENLTNVDTLKSTSVLSKNSAHEENFSQFIGSDSTTQDMSNDPNELDQRITTDVSNAPYMLHSPLSIRGLARVPEDDEDFVADSHNLCPKDSSPRHDVTVNMSDLSFDVEEIHIDDYSPEPRTDNDLVLCTPSLSAPMILNEASLNGSPDELRPVSPLKDGLEYSHRMSRQQSTPEMAARKKSSYALIATDDNYGLDYAFRTQTDMVPSFIKEDKKFKFIKVGKVQKFVHLFEEQMEKEPSSTVTSKNNTRPGSPLRRAA